MPHTNKVELLPNAGWDERILVCQNGRLVSTFIVVTQRYVVLVDTLINVATAEQMVAFACPSLDPGRQLLVINTHADYDHAWGNQLFAGATAKYPAPIFGSRLCAEFLRGPETLNEQQLLANEPEIFGDLIRIAPTITFDHDLWIDGGDLSLHLFPTPGHTSDHLSIYIPEINTLLAGDAAELPYPAARTPNGLSAMRKSLATLAALNASSVLYCHAPVGIGPQLLHDNIAYFDQIEAHCRAAIQQGRLPTDDPVADLATLIDLPFAKAVPATVPWQSVHEWYRTKGHAEQIQTMLTWLQ